MYFLKRKFFNSKAGAAGSIDKISSKLSRLQLISQDIKATETPTDLDAALTLINSVDNEAYTIAKYHLEDLRELTLADTKERLKLVEQKIKDEITPNDEIANKALENAKGGKLCFMKEKPPPKLIRTKKKKRTMSPIKLIRQLLRQNSC